MSNAELLADIYRMMLSWNEETPEGATNDNQGNQRESVVLTRSEVKISQEGES
jgi:hypothetical protein